jgi:hypothetical protein
MENVCDGTEGEQVRVGGEDNDRGDEMVVAARDETRLCSLVSDRRRRCCGGDAKCSVETVFVLRRRCLVSMSLLSSLSLEELPGDVLLSVSSLPSLSESAVFSSPLSSTMVVGCANVTDGAEDDTGAGETRVELARV